MIENQPPRLEPTTEDQLDESKQKPYFPVAMIVVIGVLIALIITCFILVKVFE